MTQLSPPGLNLPLCIADGMTRRAVLIGFCAAASSAAAADGTLNSYVADQFVDSVGVCTHLESAPYNQRFDQVLRLCALLGVRHLRDELRPNNDLRRWSRLSGEAGLRSHLLVSPATNTIAEMLAFVRALGPDAVSAIEGQNEGDSAWFKTLDVAQPGWAEVVVAYQRAVYQALRSETETRSISIVSPTVLDYQPIDMELLRAAAPFCDLVGLHAYPQGDKEPETDDDFAGIKWYLRNIRNPFKPEAPAMVTETGYATGAARISDQAASIYLPRLLLHLFARGIVRTFVYELMDEGRDTDDPEQNYGLLTVEAEPKPAFHTIRLLLESLADPGPAFAAAPLSLSIEQGPADLRVLSFRKRDGVSVVALWRTARAWDPVKRRDLVVDPAPIRLRLPAGSAAAKLALVQGGAWSLAPVYDDCIALDVAGTVNLVRLSA